MKTKNSPLIRSPLSFQFSVFRFPFIKPMPYTYEYPRPAVTADCIVITREERPRVLLIQRGGEPFRGHWALPGGFMDMDETAQECAMRELTEETGLTVTETLQVGAYSRVDRDPRGRTVGIAYLAIIESPMPVQGSDDAAKAEWWYVDNLPTLAFDHADMMRDAMRLYNSIVSQN